MTVWIVRWTLIIKCAMMNVDPFSLFFGLGGVYHFVYGVGCSCFSYGWLMDTFHDLWFC
jgi:hypothetical protein